MQRRCSSVDSADVESPGESSEIRVIDALV